MKRTLLSIVSALMLLAAAGCRGGAPEQPPAPDKGDIRVGGYAELSGRTSAAGQATKNGAQLAADEINNAGGVGGRKLEVVFEDDRGDAEGAASAVARLTGGRVRAVIAGSSPRAPSAPAEGQAAGRAPPPA